MSLAGRPEYPPPSYPEYRQLRVDAEASLRADSGFMDPAKMRRLRMLARGYDWKLSVLGHPEAPDDVELHLLLLADERGVQPPLPAWLAAAREEAAARQAELDAQRAEQRRRDQDAWKLARGLSPAYRGGLLQVRYNVRGEGRYASRGGGRLAHVAPTQDVWSGTPRRLRRHPAGRALCETERRRRPLQLGEPTDAPATCERCLGWVLKVRPTHRNLVR